jgi:NAD+ kinase
VPLNPRLHFVASPSEEAQSALLALTLAHGNVEPESADVVVALGGDGLMLQTLHAFMGSGIPIYGMNRGSLGFLMNDFSAVGLLDRIAHAERSEIRPLVMEVERTDGTRERRHALNEVSMLRQTNQAAHLEISIDGRVRLAELVGDGVLVATPAGSTAYNLSVHGPIIPIDSALLALTPISPFRPRRWRGALMPSSSRIEVRVLDAERRSMAATADHSEVRDVARVTVYEDQTIALPLLFDPGRSLSERIFNEQFGF